MGVEQGQPLVEATAWTQTCTIPSPSTSVWMRPTRSMSSEDPSLSTIGVGGKVLEVSAIRCSMICRRKIASSPTSARAPNWRLLLGAMAAFGVASMTFRLRFGSVSAASGNVSASLGKSSAGYSSYAHKTMKSLRRDPKAGPYG